MSFSQNQFDESKVRRDGVGKFSDKEGEVPELGFDENQPLEELEQERGEVFIGQCPNCGATSGPKPSPEAVQAWGESHDKKTPEELAAEGDYDAMDEDDATTEDGKPTREQRFYKKGLLNRRNGPAVRIIDTRDGSGLYYRNGKLTRFGGPAIADSSDPLNDEWWVDGEEVELSQADAAALSQNVESVLTSLDKTFNENGMTEARSPQLRAFTQQVAAHAARRAILNERTATLGEGRE
jgi:hypothetical protein